MRLGVFFYNDNQRFKDKFFFVEEINGTGNEEFNALIDFYAALTIMVYPKFLWDSIDQKGGVYNTGLGAWEREPQIEDKIELLGKGKIKFSNEMGSTLISEEEFLEINLMVAHKCLEAVAWFGLHEKGIINEEWINSIKKWIKENAKDRESE